MNPSGFGHIETIAERSALHDWEISAHRHRHGLQALIVAEGRVDAMLDGRTANLAGPCFVLIPVGAVHGFRFSPATRGWVLTLDHEFARRAWDRHDSLAQLLAEGGQGALPQEASRRVAVLAQELVALGHDWSGSGPFHALAEALLRSLPMSPSKPEASEDSRLALFRHLIEVHLAEHRPMRFYAASLGTTERTLTRIVQRGIGCTPLEAINLRVALEARRLLRHTNASLAQVAGELGFADGSYFSRFYLRMTGRRPSAERDG